MRTIISLGFFLVATGIPAVWSQCVLTLSDGSNQQRVGDAFVEAVTENGQSHYLLSDLNGEVIIPNDAPLRLLTVQHLNYRFQQQRNIDPCGLNLVLDPDTLNLNQVVITGQHKPQSLQRSVLRVQTIDRDVILQSGARTLSDVLIYSEGVQMDRDPAIGSRSLRIAGADGNNVKVLIDGVPVAGRVGFGFDIDQLNLTDIERVEIVEGPMSVEYGTQALAGVINIITRGRNGDLLNVRATIQEETTGSQYGLDEGTHNYSLSGAGRLSEKLNASAGFTRNYFGGAQINLSGRAREWDPKTQYQAYAELGARLNRWNLVYRVEGLDENIDNLGAPAGIDPPIALDDKYHTQRLANQFRFGKPINRLGFFSGHLSYTHYNRIKNSLVTNLNTGNSQLVTNAAAQDSNTLKALNGRWQLGHAFSEYLSAQGGMELQYERARGGRIEGSGFREFTDVGLFLTGEWSLSPSFTLRPGARMSYNSLYPAPVTPSMHLLYKHSGNLQMRIGYGRGFRAPELRELYFNFFDATHQIVGNPDLRAEHSDFFEASVSKALDLTDGQLSLNLRGYYQDVRDRIDFVQSASDPTLTTLDNIAKLETSSFVLSGDLKKKVYTLTLGTSLLGTGQVIAATGGQERWSWTPVVQAGLGMDILKEKVNLRLNYRWQGKSPVFRYDEESGNILSLHQESYQFADVMVNWKALPGTDLSLGLRNLFNVRSVQTAGAVGGVHTGGSESFLGYGRSLVLKINYQFIKKQAE